MNQTRLGHMSIIWFGHRPFSAWGDAGRDAQRVAFRLDPPDPTDREDVSRVPSTGVSLFAHAHEAPSMVTKSSPTVVELSKSIPVFIAGLIDAIVSVSLAGLVLGALCGIAWRVARIVGGF